MNAPIKRRRGWRLTNDAILDAAVAEIDYLKRHPEDQVIALPKGSRRALHDNGLLTLYGVEAAAAAGRMPLRAKATVWHFTPKNERRGRKGRAEYFQRALAQRLGLKHTDARWTGSAESRREALLDAAVKEVAYLLCHPADQVVTRHGKPVRALDDAGLLTIAGLDAAAKAGRIPVAGAAAVSRFGRAPVRVEVFRRALAVRLGIDPALVRSNQADVTGEQLLDAAVAEVNYLKNHPDDQIVMTSQGPRRALTDDNLLTIAGLEAASAAGRMPLGATSLMARFSETAARIEFFQRALAERLGLSPTVVETRPPRRDVAGVTQEAILDAAVSEIEFLCDHPEARLVPTRKGPTPAIGRNGLLTRPGIDAAASAGRMPVGANATARRFAEGKEDIHPFQRALAGRLGMDLNTVTFKERPSTRGQTLSER